MADENKCFCESNGIIWEFLLFFLVSSIFFFFTYSFAFINVRQNQIAIQSYTYSVGWKEEKKKTKSIWQLLHMAKRRFSIGNGLI